MSVSPGPREHNAGARITQEAGLSALFAPRSIAIVGASARSGRPGHQVLEALVSHGPGLEVHPITPRYDEILGIACLPTIDCAPPVDLAIIAGGAQRVEADIADAITAGARSLLVFGAPYTDRPAWLARITEQARTAGVPLLGPDTLGFANLAAGVAATWAKPEVPAGSVALVSQSGTVYWEANTCDPRLGFALTVHTGLEASLTLADAMSYALECEPTRVVALYLETIRDPEAFAAALAAAAERDIPVVALYAGRTERARVQMTTHAGRMAGDRASLEGLFRRYDAVMTTTLDEWWATIALLAGPRRMGRGGLSAVMDSGGGLAMFLDHADALRVPLADLSPATRSAVGGLLAVDDPQGSAIDFWVGEVDRHATTEELLVTLAADESTAAVLAFTTYGEPRTAGFAAQVARACLAAAERTHKPVIAACYSSRQLHPELLLELSRAGIPTLDGMQNALAAFGHVLRRQAVAERRAALSPPEELPALPHDRVGRWRARLGSGGELMEAQALVLLSEFGIPTVPVRLAQDETAAVTAAAELGFPVVLKTDQGIGHKAARGGVRIDISDQGQLAAAYREMAAALGPRVLVAPMVDGVEVALGVVEGEFGPTLMISAGGGLIEWLNDRCYLLAPVGPEEVEQAMDGLQITSILKRDARSTGRMDEFYALTSRVSEVAAALSGTIRELDINPIMVGEAGCIAVDALVATTMPGGERHGT